MADTPRDLAHAAISFDFDGVLARSPFGHGVLFPVLRELAHRFSQRTGTGAEQAERHARELAWAEFRGHTARGDYVRAYDWQLIVETIARLMGERFKESLGQMTREYAERVARAGDDSPAYPHAREVLANLKARGACLILLTNGFREYQLPMTEALGLAPNLDAIMASDDLGTVKPLPEAFEKAFRACPRAHGSRRYHVGDTLSHDVLGARGCGIFSIWIEWDLAEALRSLDPLERARSALLEEVLRAKLAREASFQAPRGYEHPGLDLVRPDAVVMSLREVGEVVGRAEAGLERRKP